MCGLKQAHNHFCSKRIAGIKLKWLFAMLIFWPLFTEARIELLQSSLLLKYRVNELSLKLYQNFCRRMHLIYNKTFCLASQWFFKDRSFETFSKAIFFTHFLSVYKIKTQVHCSNLKQRLFRKIFHEWFLTIQSCLQAVDCLQILDFLNSSKPRVRIKYVCKL